MYVRNNNVSERNMFQAVLQLIMYFWDVTFISALVSAAVISYDTICLLLHLRTF